MKEIKSSVHEFYDLQSTKFLPSDYSKLKFGCDVTAKKFGRELADDVFLKHSDVLLSNSVVVIPSPYNHVKNAATVMTGHFIDRLNHLLVNANGSHVEYSIIHRKVSYINDYGFLSKDKRKGLINNDKFYLNRDFYEDKLLIFVDDVRITGTHEEKLQEILDEQGFTNDRMFLYYADYWGSFPEVEAQINFAGIKSPADYLALAQTPNHHVIVRPIKYILSRNEKDCAFLLEKLPLDTLAEIYHGALGEGYYKIPAYQVAFKALSDKVCNKV